MASQFDEQTQQQSMLVTGQKNTVSLADGARETQSSPTIKFKNDSKRRQLSLGQKKSVLDLYRRSDYEWDAIVQHFPELRVEQLREILRTMMVGALLKLNKGWSRVCSASEIKQLTTSFLEYVYKILTLRKQQTEEGELDLAKILSDYMFLSKSKCDKNYSQDVKSILYVILKKIIEASREAIGKKHTESNRKLTEDYNIQVYESVTPILPDYIHNRKKLHNEIQLEDSRLIQYKEHLTQECENLGNDEEKQQMELKIREFYTSFTLHTKALERENSSRDYRDIMLRREVYIYFCMRLLHESRNKNSKSCIEKVFIQSDCEA